MYIYKGKQYNNIDEILDYNIGLHNNRLLQKLKTKAYIDRMKDEYQGNYEFMIYDDENNEIKVIR